MCTKVNTHPAKPILAEMMATLQLAPGNKMNKEMMSEIELQLDDWEARLEEEEKKKEEEKKGKGNERKEEEKGEAGKEEKEEVALVEKKKKKNRDAKKGKKKVDKKRKEHEEDEEEKSKKKEEELSTVHDSSSCCCVFRTGCSDVLVLSWSAGHKAELGAQLHTAQGALHHLQGNHHSPQ